MTSKRSSVTSSTMLMKVELRNSEREKDIMNYIINVFPSTMKSPHPPPKGIPPGLPKWKNDSNRRQKILNSGMLTPKGKAYRCVGEPIMDNEKLFISMLSNEDQKTLTGILDRKYGTSLKPEKKKRVSKTPETRQPTIAHRLDKKNKEYSHIQDYLTDLQEVKKRLQLKKPLAQCLEEVSEAKVSARRKDKPKLISLEMPSTKKTDPRNRTVNDMVEKLTIINQLLRGMTLMQDTDLTSVQPLEQSYMDNLMAENSSGLDSSDTLARSHDLKTNQSSGSSRHFERSSTTLSLQLPAGYKASRNIPPWYISELADSAYLPLPPKPPAPRETGKSPFIAAHRRKFKDVQDSRDFTLTRMEKLIKAEEHKTGNVPVRLQKDVTKTSKSANPESPPPYWIFVLEADIKKKIRFSSLPYAKEKLCLLALSH